jgi:hypothetical protein
MEKEKATLYINSEFYGCPQKLEIYLLEHGTKEYAQYKAAPYVKYILKGKRTARQIIKGYNPFFVIVKGWDTPEPPKWHNKPTYDNGMELKQSKYTCHDEMYLMDFNTWFEPFKMEIIADYRENKKVHDYSKPMCLEIKNEMS